MKFQTTKIRFLHLKALTSAWIVFGFCTQLAVGIMPRPSIEQNEQVHSLIIYAKMTQSGHSMDLYIAVRGNKIRATLGHFPARITVFHFEDSMIAYKEIGEKQEKRIMNEEEAARQLMEMLAICPQYFFDDRLQTIFDFPLLQSYSLELRMIDDEKTKAMPSTLQLRSGKNKPPIQMARYVEYFDDDDTREPPLLMKQPSKLIIINRSTGQESAIEITHIERNAGLPDFVFNPDFKFEWTKPEQFPEPNS